LNEDFDLPDGPLYFQLLFQAVQYSQIHHKLTEEIDAGDGFDFGRF
jgi:hypothetical protein